MRVLVGLAAMPGAAMAHGGGHVHPHGVDGLVAAIVMVVAIGALAWARR